MTNFLDRFGLRRRAAPRIRARWLIDVQVPGKDSFTGFFTRDASAAGLFLEGAKPNAFSEMAKVRGGITIRIRLPVPLGIVEAQAEVKWERGSGREGAKRMGVYEHKPRGTQINRGLRRGASGRPAKGARIAPKVWRYFSWPFIQAR